jgi:CRP-like cAMP-binding protein
MDNAPDTPAEQADLASLVALLRATWFSAGLSPEAQLSLARLALRHQVPAGTMLLAEGDAVRELRVVLRGRVSMRTPVPEPGLSPS